ncbi:MAG: ABC transporter substrate-binding protein [Ruminiclostridium sp.]
MRRILAIALAAAILALCGCSAAPNEAENSADAVTFTDALGREVSVEKNPDRTAALIGSFADVWQLSGGTICAAPEDAWDDFELELPDAVNLGGAHSPSFEVLLSSDPDFVIGSASTAADVEMKEQLEKAGIPVAYFDVDCFEDYLEMLDICTDITGRKDLYETNGLNVKSEIERIKAEFSDAEVPEEKRTVLLLRASAGFIKAKGSEGTILGEMLADFGCVNIADSDTSLLEDLSVESVIRREPYHIFVVTMGDDTEKALENLTRMMEENPAWGTLSAVKENRLHVMDRKLFNIKPNADWAEAYEKLSGILTEKD